MAAQQQSHHVLLPLLFSGLGLGVWGWGFGVWGLGFGVWGLGFGVWGLGRGAWGVGFTSPQHGAHVVHSSESTHKLLLAQHVVGFRV